MPEVTLFQKQLPNNADTVDLTYLSIICDHDKQFMREMIENFTKEMPDNISYITQQIEEKNWLEVKKLMHKMKPSLQFVGLANTLEYVRIIEQQSKEEENHESISLIFQKVHANIGFAVDILRIFVAKELGDL